MRLLLEFGANPRAEDERGRDCAMGVAVGRKVDCKSQLRAREYDTVKGLLEGKGAKVREFGELEALVQRLWVEMVIGGDDGREYGF